ncbi:GTPase-activating protein [Martiniozyma asiatica (nom. inval.)]|nr:GTPase-activating protein [Martiniozyma asiatica]
MDIYNIEEIDGVRFNWNCLPTARIETTNMAGPLGCIYSPLMLREDLPTANYAPQTCRACQMVLNIFSQLDLNNKVWSCPGCGMRNQLPPGYHNITPEAMPIELLRDSSTMEYILPRSQPPPPPAFIYVVDLCQDKEDLDSLKETILESLDLHPPGCMIGLITFDSVVNVYELSFQQCSKRYVFSAEKEMSSIDVQELLGIKGNSTITWDQQLQKKDGTINRFLLPISSEPHREMIEKSIKSLKPSKWIVKPTFRALRVTGTALHIATCLIEGAYAQCAGKITLFAAGACTYGPGKIVGTELKEPLRSHNDIEKGTATHYKSADKFYKKLTNKAFSQLKEKNDKMVDQTSSSLFSVDIFAGCYDQVGIYEMRPLSDKTGGVCLVTDSFQTAIFKNSFLSTFTKNDDGYPTTFFDGQLSIVTSPKIKVSGIIGHCKSLKKSEGNNVADVQIGEGLSNTFQMNTITPRNNYAIFFDVDTAATGDQRISMGTTAYIQFKTTYRHNDGTYRLRVTTLCRATSNAGDLSQSFDQEAAAVLFTRMAVNKLENGGEYSDLLRWIDKSLVKLCSVFGDYSKNNPDSFKLSNKFSLLPQFIYHLRRSQFLQVFNCSPDETAFYHHTVLRTDTTDSLVMIQPSLIKYTADGEEPMPVLLDSLSLKQDAVFLLDAFFYTVIYFGKVAASWRDQNFSRDEYPGVYKMIEDAQQEAASLIADRFPLPRYVTCDEGKSQARFLYSKLNPSENTSNGKMGNFGGESDKVVHTEDVALQTFYSHLVKLVVTTQL